MKGGKRRVLKGCAIYQTLRTHARKKHISFHTPGHKRGKWDITELSYSDNLASPRGCIAQAEKEIADLLGAQKSFLLTDGSTAGVHAMLYAAKRLGAERIAVVGVTHKSAFSGCLLAGLTPLVYEEKRGKAIPLPPTMDELKENCPQILQAADAIFLTSPNYYGRVAQLAPFQAYCKQTNKLLLVDGAHGGHLRFDRTLYAGTFADMWVDGVHKSLPALTQGAVASAKDTRCAQALQEGVELFRTTSPSYPIMASVEYAVKYPRNERLEKEARAFADEWDRVTLGEDWTKLCIRLGDSAFAVQKDLEKKGIYAEFCDGNILTFYLSPATELRAFRKLKKEVKRCAAAYPYTESKTLERNPAPVVFPKNGEREWIELARAEGKICACDCGLFPPCTPLIRAGEKIEKERIALLQAATNVYGLREGKICVWQGDDV